MAYVAGSRPACPTEKTLCQKTERVSEGERAQTQVLTNCDVHLEEVEAPGQARVAPAPPSPARGPLRLWCGQAGGRVPVLTFLRKEP